MKLNEYQKAAAETAQYQDRLYPVTSLMVEAAELADLFIKPWLRGDAVEIDNRDKVISEAGDVLWNLSQVLTDMRIDFDEVAEANLAKIKSRSERGLIQGSGGDR